MSKIILEYTANHIYQISIAKLKLYEGIFLPQENSIEIQYQDINHIVGTLVHEGTHKIFINYLRTRLCYIEKIMKRSLRRFR